MLFLYKNRKGLREALVRHIVTELPEDLRPTHWSESERGKRYEIGSEPDIPKLARLGEDYMSDFLVRPNTCTYTVTRGWRGTDIFVTTKTHAVEERLFDHFLNYELPFYAEIHERKEWEAKVDLTFDMYDMKVFPFSGYVAVETKDFLPGLFWKGVYEASYLKHIGLTLPLLKEVAYHVEELPADTKTHWLIQLTENRSDWKTPEAKAAYVKLLASGAHMFSKPKALALLHDYVQHTPGPEPNKHGEYMERVRQFLDMSFGIVDERKPMSVDDY